MDTKLSPALQLERPVVSLDLEATGVDFDFDRIVEIGMVRLSPNGAEHEYRSLINPGIPIPSETTEIHGIRDEDVAAAPTFADVALDVRDFLSGADLVGYNHQRFDVPMLRREFSRSDVTWDTSGCRFVDVNRIFHAMEPRTLSAAVRFFCDRELEGAHGALADSRATLAVLQAQLERYSELPRGIEDLDKRFNAPDPNFVDRTRRFRWRHREPHFAFGEFRGRSLAQIAAERPDAIDRMLRGSFSREVKRLLEAALRGEVPTRPQKQ